MQRFTWFHLFAFLILVAGQVRAEEPKPVMVISIASYDKFISAAGVAGKLSGLNMPMPLDKRLEKTIEEMTGGKGIVGLDKTKPFGFIVPGTVPPPDVIKFGPGREFKHQRTADLIAFAPIADLKPALAALPPMMLQMKDEADGVVHVERPKNTFLKGAGGWVFASPSTAESLKSVPADPGKLLGDLPTRYLVAIRITPQNMSPEMKKIVSEGFEEMAREMIEGHPKVSKADLRRAPGDPAPQPRRDSPATTILANQLKKFDQIDELTVGLNLDPASGKVIAEVSVAAQPDTQLARILQGLGNAKTQFAGLRAADAVFSACLCMTGPLPPDHQEALKQQHDAAAARAREAIDQDRNLPDEAKVTIKEALATLLSVGHDTLKSGERDGGLAMFMGPHGGLVVAGVRVTDGSACEAAVKKLASAAEGDENFPKIKWDAETHQGIKFHTMAVPVRAGDVRALFGDSLQMVLATGKEGLWLAIGADPIPKLKAVIDASANPAETPSVAMALRIKGFMDRIAQEEPDNIFATAIKKLEALGPAADQATLSSAALPNGAQFRVEVNQGIIQAIAAIATEDGPGKSASGRPGKSGKAGVPGGPPPGSGKRPPGPPADGFPGGPPPGDFPPDSFKK